MIVEDCEFCQEFSSGRGLFQKSLGQPHQTRIILQIGNLLVFPTLGAIVPGHLLVSPAYHVTSMLSLVDSDRAALKQIRERVDRCMVSDAGQHPVFFEHGDPTGEHSSYGQCISHAHVHILPVFVDMLPRLLAERKLIAVADSPNSDITIPDPYLSYSVGASSPTYYFSAIEAPRQYLRALYSELVGKPGAEHWYANVRAQETLSTAERYRSLLNA